MSNSVDYVTIDSITDDSVYERQLRLMEQSKHEILLLNDAKSSLYETKIKSLQNVINNLQNQLQSHTKVTRKLGNNVGENKSPKGSKTINSSNNHKNLVLETSNSTHEPYLGSSYSKETKESIDEVNSSADTSLEKELEGLRALNTELLQQNELLRIERDKLLSSGSSVNDYPSINGIPKNVSKEIRNILNPPEKMLASIKPKQLKSQLVQTNIAFNQDYNDLQQQVLELEQNLRMEQQNTKDIKKLLQKECFAKQKVEDQYSKMANDLEISIVAEKIAKEGFKKHQSTIDEYEKELESLSKEIAHVKKCYLQQERENAQLKTIIETQDKIRNMNAPSIDPIEFLQNQWDSERISLKNNISQLNKYILKLQEGKKLLEKELKLVKESAPDPLHYAEVLAFNSLASDQINQLKLDQESNTLLIDELQADNDEKDGTITLLKSNIKEQDDKLQQLECKLKSETSQAVTKESLVKSLKSKLKSMEEQLSLKESSLKSMEALEKQNNDLRGNLKRKEIILKSWKEDLQQLRNELDSTNSKPKVLERKVVEKVIDKKQINQLRELNLELQKYKKREEQYKNVLNQLLMEPRPPPFLESIESNLEYPLLEINELADKFALQYLGLHLQQIGGNTKIDGVSRLTKILEHDNFEDKLVDLMRNMICQ